MGTKFEVSIWIFHEPVGWYYASVWRGNSFFKAIIVLVQQKRKTECAKLEWRKNGY